MRSRGVFLLAAACVCLFADALSAQETISYGTISGRVTDPQGAVVPGARARATQVETGQTRDGISDVEGRFRFPYLRVGSYVITVQLAGFAEAMRNVNVTVGSAFEIPIALSVASVDASVTVTGETTVLEAARSQIAGTVSQAEIQSLPLNGRNFLDFALLVPGVSPTNTGSTQLFAETSAVPGQGISIGSQRNFSNNFIVDGLSANDDAAGFSGIPYGVDAVDQFQVVTSGGHAELGRALGGYVSVITKSGTNTPRGNVYAYFRDDAMNARNALLSDSGAPKPEMSQKQWGASMGGPIARNRTFYFSNVEQRVLDQTGLTTITDQNVAVINARLRSSGYPGSPDLDGQLSESDRHGEFSRQARSPVQQPPESHRSLLALRCRVAELARRRCAQRANGVCRARQSRSVAGAEQYVDAVVEDGQRNALSGGAWRLEGAAKRSDRARRRHCGRRTLRDLVGKPARARQHDVSDGEQRLAPGGQPCDPRRRRFHLQRRHDYLSAIGTRGIHVFVAREFSFGNLQHVWVYADVRVSTVSQTNPNVGIYLQDEWKVRPAVTINAGVRYDLQFLETVSTDTDNLSPRVGFAWTPTQSRRLIVRGSAGLFFDRVPLRALANALLSAGNTTDLNQLQQVNVSLSPTQAGAPVFPGILDAADSVGDARQPDDAGSEHAERVLASGQPRGRTAGGREWNGERRLSIRARRQPDHAGESERAHVCRRGHEQRMPSEPRVTRTTISIRQWRSRIITACICHSCSGRRRGDTTGCRTAFRSR